MPKIKFNKGKLITPHRVVRSWGKISNISVPSVSLHQFSILKGSRNIKKGRYVLFSFISQHVSTLSGKGTPVKTRAIGQVEGTVRASGSNPRQCNVRIIYAESKKNPGVFETSSGQGFADNFTVPDNQLVVVTTKHK